MFGCTESLHSYMTRWWFQILCLFWSNLTSIFWFNHQVDDILQLHNQDFWHFLVESLKPKNLPKCHPCDKMCGENAWQKWQTCRSVQPLKIFLFSECSLGVGPFGWGGLGRRLGKVACGDVFFCGFLACPIERSNHLPTMVHGTQILGVSEVIEHARIIWEYNWMPRDW